MKENTYARARPRVAAMPARTVQFDTVAPARTYLRRVYVGLVTGLALFIVLVVTSRSRVTSYEATASVVCASTSPAGRTVLQGFVQQQLGQDFGTAIDASFSSPAPGDPTIIRLSHINADQAAAMSMLDDAAERLAEAINRHPPESIGDARRSLNWQLFELRHYERQARFELDNFVDEYFFTIHDVAEATQELPEFVNTDDRARSASTAKADRGEAVFGLLKQIEKAKAERDRLGTMYMSRHPRILDADRDIERLQARLHELNRQERHEIPTSVMVDKTEAADESPGYHVQLTQATVDRYNNLREAYVEAVLSCEQLESTADRQVQATVPTKWMATRQSHAAISRRLGAAFSKPTVLMALGLSALVGSILFLASSCLTPIRVFRTSESVGHELQVPVVAKVGVSEGPTIPRARGRLRVVTVRTITLLSELILAIALFLFLFQTLSASPHMAAFGTDPLGTLAESVLRLASVLGL